MPLFFRAEVILLFSSVKIDIATSSTSLEVTLCPSSNENFMFLSSSSLDSLGPPP